MKLMIRIQNSITPREERGAAPHNYNNRRLHSSLNYQTPAGWEASYRQPQANKAA